MRSYAAADVRAAEEPLLAAGAQLMANAALAVELVTVRELRSRRGAVRGGRVLALVGSGNNGGDGLFAAAGLARRGVDVTVLLLGASPHVGGLAAVRGTGVRPVDLGGLAPEEAARRVVARLDGRLDAPPVDVVLDAVTG
ncbi:MAG: bifunctional ADP-dependent (S)-NAD(P)H-hydrate dehydratase/NAD(P)H-hydrate epimerase, partial [Salana multivorans]|nr:bifunctional ADP-dependent (S)-NAD(P)H-hydrate dehydratase/NAD(P)H-hydrate epimerase [Salana multivorans]